MQKHNKTYYTNIWSFVKECVFGIYLFYIYYIETHNMNVHQPPTLTPPLLTHLKFQSNKS